MTMKGVRKGFFVAFLLLTVAIAGGCHSALKKEAQRPEEALRQARLFSPEFRHDMDSDSLTLAVRRKIEYLDLLGPETVFHYGPNDFTRKQVRESQETFLDLLTKGFDPDHLSRETRKKFRAKVQGPDIGNEVFVQERVRGHLNSGEG